MPDKARERRYLERFRSNLRDFPTGTIEDSEEPDFLIRLSTDQILGIEVTRLFREPDPGLPPRQSRESMNRLVLGEAERLLRAQDPRPLVVAVRFNRQWFPTKPEAYRAARSLVDLARQTALVKGQEVRIASPDQRLKEHQDAVSALILTWPESSEETFWGGGDADRRAEATTTLVQRAIDQKNIKVPEYRLKASVLWLLVVTDNGVISQALDVPAAVADHKYTIAFERAFLFDAFSTALHVLSGTGPAPPGA